jgi:hypothetical protein
MEEEHQAPGTGTSMGSALLNVALGLSALLFILGYSLILEAASVHPLSGDFLKFHLSAQFLVQGEDIYQSVPAIDFAVDDTLHTGVKEELHPNLNPPFQTVLLAPLAVAEYKTAYIVWGALSLACGLVGALILGALLGFPGRRVLAGLVLANLLLFYFPTFIAVFSGQWSLLPFVCLVVAWANWRKGNQAVAGAILGAVAAVKLFFGAFFLLFLARREWRASALFVGVWTACTAVAVATTGLDTSRRYLAILGDAVWYSASWNASFRGFFSRVFGGSEGEPLFDIPVVTSVLNVGLSALAIFLLFWMSRAEVRKKPIVILDDLAFSFCVVIMLLVSPFGWMYYFPFLFIPFVVLWRASFSLEHGRTYRLMGALAWVLSTVPRFIVPIADFEGDLAIIFGWAGAYFYALVLLSVLIWTTHRKIGRPVVSG